MHTGSTGRVRLRLLGQCAGLTEDELASRLDDSGIKKVRDTLERLPLFIDDDSQPTVQGIRIRCRRLHTERGLGLMLVDDVGLVARRNGDPVQLQSEVAEGLEGLARELDVAVVVTLGLPPGCAPDDLFGVPDFRHYIGDVDTVLVVEEGDDRVPQLRLVHNRYGECGLVEVAALTTAEDADLLPF